MDQVPWVLVIILGSTLLLWPLIRRAQTTNPISPIVLRRQIDELEKRVKALEREATSKRPPENL